MSPSGTLLKSQPHLRSGSTFSMLRREMSSNDRTTSTRALVQQMQDTTTNNYSTSLRQTISSSDRVRCIKQPVEREEPLAILVLCRHRTTNNYSASPRQTISSSDRVRCIKQLVESEEPLVILVLYRHILFEYKNEVNGQQNKSIRTQTTMSQYFSNRK